MRAEAKNELLLQPNDEMLLDMIDLVIAHGRRGQLGAPDGPGPGGGPGPGADRGARDGRPRRPPRGDREGARRWWEEALDAGERIPNVMGERIRRRLDELD